MTRLMRPSWLRVEVHRVGCIVTAALAGALRDAGRCAVLINPANRTLSGTKAPYFPVGGPVPAEPGEGWQASSRWCGMEAGERMLYPAQAVDGVVTREGGRELRMALDGVAGGCPVGQAVTTPALGRLHSVYGWHAVVHCCPPLFPSDGGDHADSSPASQALLRTWASALHAAVQASPADRRGIAVPLLGAGACGAPTAAAATAAAEAVAVFQAHHEGGQQDATLRIGVQTGAVAECLVEALGRVGIAAPVFTEGTG